MSDLAQKSFQDGIRALRIVLLEEMDKPDHAMKHTHNLDVEKQHQADYCWRCKIEKVLNQPIGNYKINCMTAERAAGGRAGRGMKDYRDWLVQQIELWKRTMQGEAELHNTHAWERASARVTAYKDSLEMFDACERGA